MNKIFLGLIGLITLLIFLSGCLGFGPQPQEQASTGNGSLSAASNVPVCDPEDQECVLPKMLSCTPFRMSQFQEGDPEQGSPRMEMAMEILGLKGNNCEATISFKVAEGPLSALPATVIKCSIPKDELGKPDQGDIMEKYCEKPPFMGQ
ncbi:MAG TPA: hypothetical protein VJK05_04570 [archaeon]|nr:hypothetical protein [archaeon]